jgi:hypothetical protein
MKNYALIDWIERRKWKKQQQLKISIQEASVSAADDLFSSREAFGLVTFSNFRVCLFCEKTHFCHSKIAYCKDCYFYFYRMDIGVQKEQIEKCLVQLRAQRLRMKKKCHELETKYRGFNHSLFLVHFHISSAEE